MKFAQEVSEAKAMDDMLDKMEKLMGKDEKAVAGILTLSSELLLIDCFL